MKRRTKNSEAYRRYRLKQALGLARYCFTVLVLVALIIWAPTQASQFTGYLGAFILGGTKAKQMLGL
jgi:hypothetical protein